MAGKWRWFDVKEKHCWLAGEAASRTEPQLQAPAACLCGKNLLEMSFF